MVHATLIDEHDRPEAITTLWSLREDVRVETFEDGDAVELHSRWSDLRVRNPEPGLVETLRRMSLGPVSLDNVSAGRAEGTPRSWQRALLRLQDLVVRSLAFAGSGQLLLSAVPLTHTARFAPEPPPDDALLKLSRFALLRCEGDLFRLESPLSLHRVVLHRPEAQWVVSALARPVTAAKAGDGLPLAASVVREILGYLVGTGMVLVAQTPEGDFDEDRDPVLRTWSVHDMLFHTRSVLGRDDGDYGATFAHAARLAPQPAVKPPPSGPVFALPRPDLDDVLDRDPRFTSVLEGRRSGREYGPALDLSTLGEFLYRTARVRSLGTVGSGETAYPATDRPYPTGGAVYDLELYLTVRDCPELPTGIYHYDPQGHRLVLVDDAPAAVGTLSRGAMAAAALSAPPPVLITLTSRFQRLSWKYSGLTYSLVLKHVGALVQTFYLVGTAMGLAGCAVCSEDITAFTGALGLDWRTESPVGSFVLGPAPAGRNGSGPPLGADRVGVNSPDWGARSAPARRG
ncbi:MULTISPECIES: SagB/ThcOx family dehydrogenase [Streptomyces]|uniref:SagB family peptide dehydrogenase n=1 Tax=Streptomyces lienomycini TaxID=284035 RepID=A0ABV9WT61_9ACTN|nr:MULTISPECIES: SagB family peptide dehydrogenase [Streptomyces]